jgi:S1-C subfamily serine protease
VATELAGSSDALYPGDVIYAVNDTSVGNMAQLEAALQSAQRGETVAVHIERLGQLQFLVIEIL